MVLRWMCALCCVVTFIAWGKSSDAWLSVPILQPELCGLLPPESVFIIDATPDENRADLFLDHSSSDRVEDTGNLDPSSHLVARAEGHPSIVGVAFRNGKLGGGIDRADQSVERR